MNIQIFFTFFFLDVDVVMNAWEQPNVNDFFGEIFFQVWLNEDVK